MKKTIGVFIFFAIMYSNLFSQTISESFDSYNVGDNLTEVSSYFLPWNDDPSVDTKITNIESFSGDNSIRVYNNGEDYYTDLILQVYQGEVYEEGIYEFNTKMMIKANSKAFMRLDSDIGGGREHYSILCENGMCMIENSEGYGLDGSEHNEKVYFGFPYKENEWFDLKFTSYIDSKRYNVNIKVDDACVGTATFSPNFKPIISYNIWAIDGADFYLDDIRFSVIEQDYEAQSHSNFLNVNNRINGVNGENLTITGGLFFEDTTTSYTIELTSNGSSQEFQFDHLQEDERRDYFCITPDFQFDTDLDLHLELTKINGEILESNDHVCEGENSIFLRKLPEDRKRKVFVEGITNNKAGSTIEIEVMLDLLQERFPDHVSLVSVHNSNEDPLPTYGIEGLSSFTGLFFIDQVKFPWFDPNLEKIILEKINTPANATLRNAATVEGDTLEVQTKVRAFADIPIGWSLEHILVQDAFTGEGEAFDLVNGYGLGFNMNSASCEYKYAPELIEASEVEYDRIPLEYKKGLELDALSINDEQIYSVKLTQEGLLENLENFKIISLILNAEGEVENSETTLLTDALEADLSTNVTTIKKKNIDLQIKRVSTNYVEVSQQESQISSLEVINAAGVIQASYNEVNANNKTIDISSLVSGLYIVTVESDEGRASKLFVKE